jgi:beta-lactamase regulating signal transducer with metallopeptidase domain
MPELIEDCPLLWDVIWQTTTLLTLGLIASRLLADRPARAHAVLLLCMSAAIVAPLASAATRSAGYGLFAPLMSTTGGGGVPPADLRLEANQVVTASLWVIVFASLWAAWSVVLMSRLMVSLVRSRGVMHRTTPIEDGPIRVGAVEAAARLELRYVPDVSTSREVSCPVIWCWGRRPRLVLPVTMSDGPGLTAVLCHELAHWKRRDHLWTLAGELASCLVPWHPLLWRARRQLAQLSEHSCDAWVVAAGESRTAFAGLLLSFVPQRNATWTVAALATRCGFARRIHRILEAPPTNPRHGGRWAVMVTVAAIGVVTAASLAHRRAPDPTPRRLGPVVLTPAGISDLEPGHADVLATPAELDTGVVKPGGVGSATVWLVNTSQETRTVRGAKASCGCTAVAASLPVDLAPGASISLEITIKASQKAGERKSKHVTIDVEGQSPIKLPVHVQTE